MLPKIVKEAEAAYVKTGLKPIKDSWFDKGAACPLGALYVVNHPKKKKNAELAERWAYGKYGEEYVDGFIGGLDMDNYQIYIDNDKQQSGCRHGQILRKRLFRDSDNVD